MTKGRTGEQSAHRQAEEELFRLEHGGWKEMGGGKVEAGWDALAALLLSPKGHRVPGWGETAQEVGDYEQAAHFWGENTFSQGDVLPWPQLHSQALPQNTIISTAGQPASPTHENTTSSCLPRAGPQACTALSLPSHYTLAAGQRAASRSYFCWFPGHADPTLGTAPCLQIGCTTLHQASCQGTDGDWPCKNLPKCP